MSCDKYHKKINSVKGKYVIFYLSYCKYCISALELMKEKKVGFKGYEIGERDKKGFMECMSKYNHKTYPMIFYDGEFIGGWTELVRKLGVEK